MLERLKSWWRVGAAAAEKQSGDSFSMKRAFEQQRIGVTSCDPFPLFDREKLFRWSRQSDLAYTCIQIIVEAAQDPELIVQRRKERKAEWMTEYGHELRRLLMRPNPGYGMGPMTQAEFLGQWLASEQVCGIFIAEIERAKRTRKPVALWPLDPTLMRVNPETLKWEWRFRGELVEFADDELFISYLPDPQRPWEPLAPLAVALGSIEADALRVAFIRSFFKNAGVPSGILKVKGVLAGEEGKKRAREIQQRWIERRGGYGRYNSAPEVMDDNASYEKIGSDLSELDGGNLTAQQEARICGVFRVPPLLASAWVGLVNVNQRASAVEGQRDFWANGMSPKFKRIRTKLQWSLLPEFELDEDIFAENVRLFWDMSSVMALQEEKTNRDMRARENFRAGMWTLNQALVETGQPPVANGDYYLRLANRLPITEPVVQAQMEAAAVAAARAVSLVLSGQSTPDITEQQANGSSNSTGGVDDGEED